MCLAKFVVALLGTLAQGKTATENLKTKLFLFFKILLFFVAQIIMAGHISWIVGLIDMKQKGGASTGCWGCMCDLEPSPHPWPWPLILKVKF